MTIRVVGSFNRGEPDVQPWLLPEPVALLIRLPLLAIIYQLDIEVRDQSGHDQTHLGICQTNPDN